MPHRNLNRLSTGILGLDEVLHGGLVPGNAYLVRGGPGSGKTTLGLHFLAAGAAAGERTLLISLGEPQERIRRNGEALGLRLAHVEGLDLSPSATFFAEAQSYDIFSPAEVEREPTTAAITEAVTRLRPQRVFIDAITQFRYLSSDAFQFRRQALSFFRFLVEHGSTVLFTAEASPEAPDDDLQFMADGVVDLGRDDGGRYLTVAKLRGSDFAPGRHAMRLATGGMVLFPRLVPAEHGRTFLADTLPAGIAELDDMLHGGIEAGTITLVAGPSGAGKTTLGLQFMANAARTGKRSVLYTFEEEPELITRRGEAIGIPVREQLDRGTLQIQPVEPLRYSADEFAAQVRAQVEESKVSLVMIDGVAGYNLSIRTGGLTTHLHALCKYLQRMGVATLLISETQDITGDFRLTDEKISYLADNVVFLRYLEMDSELRRAVGVLKKRLTHFERALRQFDITAEGIRVGEPLRGLRGLLSGQPTLDPGSTEAAG